MKLASQMKILRAFVAFTLLVGVFGRKSGSKGPHHHHRVAALLDAKLHAQKKVSLDAATDKMQGVLDAVAASVKKVKIGYSAIKDSCVAEVQASSSRLQAQSVTLAELETTRTVNLERTAGSEASLANFVGQETEAHASYESAVTQRAQALQKHLSTNKATVDQADAIGKVLEMMKKKKAIITASQTSKKDFKVNAPVAPTSQGSGLDFVIGVLGNIKDTGDAKAVEGAAKHNTDDSGLEKLVNSYKTSLQHIDKQYQTENARRMQAKVTARDSAEEKSLRKMLVNGEEKLDKELIGLCGPDGKAGSVPSAISAAEYLLSQFEHRSANVINVLDGLPDLVTALLQVEQQSKLRGAPAAQPEVVYTESAAPVAAVAIPAASPQEADAGTDSAQESAARWVIAQASKFKDNTTQTSAKAVAASFPNGLPTRQLHRVRAVVPSQQLHTLVASEKTYQAMKNLVTSEAVSAVNLAPAPSPAGAAILACVKDKQDLTDKIIEARREARVARTARMSAAPRVKAVASFKVLMQKQQKVLAGAQTTAETGWTPLRNIIKKKSFSSDLTDSIAEMSSIEKDVKTYIANGGPPAAAGLPTALKGIRESLTAVQTRLQNDMKALDSVYTGSLMISYPALINQLINKEKALTMEGGAKEKEVLQHNKMATLKEATVKKLMMERATVEYRCLQAGQCGNLQYHQCCAGSGTNSKKVTNWSQCAAHCEGLIKEGKQIVGCELTGLWKKDDRSGSGTCYAQTACTLKSSSEKCAGSRCKAFPVKK